MADDSILKYSDIIGPDDTFEVIFANLDRLRSELESLAKDAQKGVSVINPNDDKAIEELTNRVKELESALSSLDKVQKKATTTRKKLNELTQEELIEREKQKIANREAVQTAKQLAIIKNSEAGSIERLRAQLSLTTLQWKKLSANERQNGVEGKRLVREKKKLTEQLKRLEKQTGDTRRNVGNYTTSLGKLGSNASAALTALINTLNDKDPDVRWRSSEALGLIGASTEDVLSGLNSLVHDKCDYVCESAINALDSLTGEYTEEFIEEKYKS